MNLEIRPAIWPVEASLFGIFTESFDFKQVAEGTRDN